LNDAVNCWFSNFKNTCAPVISDKVREGRHGVGTTAPAIAAAASRMSCKLTVME